MSKQGALLEEREDGLDDSPDIPDARIQSGDQKMDKEILNIAKCAKSYTSRKSPGKGFYDAVGSFVY